MGKGPVPPHLLGWVLLAGGTLTASAFPCHSLLQTLGAGALRTAQFIPHWLPTMPGLEFLEPSPVVTNEQSQQWRSLCLHARFSLEAPKLHTLLSPVPAR